MDMENEEQEQYAETAEEHFSPFPHLKFGLSAVVLIFFAYQISGSALYFLLPEGANAAQKSLLQGAGQLVFMLLPTVFIARYSPLGRRKLFRLSAEISPKQWIFGIAGIMAIQLFAGGLSHIQEFLVPDFLREDYRHLNQEIEEMYAAVLGGSSPLDAFRALIVGALIPALSEEMLFRGIFQRSLEEVRSPFRAIAGVAILFGFLHLNPIALIPLVLIGAYLGFLAYHSQSLALPIVAHFFNNGFAILALYIPNAELDSHAPPTLWQAFLLTAVGAAAVVLCVYLMIRHQEREQQFFR